MLDSCKPNQVPCELLTSLAGLISSEPAEAAFEAPMTGLLELELHSLPPGWGPKVTIGASCPTPSHLRYICTIIEDQNLIVKT
jgi:hypothetical protein